MNASLPKSQRLAVGIALLVVCASFTGATAGLNSPAPDDDVRLIRTEKLANVPGQTLTVVIVNSALFHDIGLVDDFHTDTKRFEVDGADAAREFLRRHGIPEAKVDLVWEAIALHTTPGIPAYMRPEIALTNAGVLMDVIGTGYEEYTPEQRDQVIAAYPRGDFKNEFIEIQTRSAMKKPRTTFGTVNFEYIEGRDPTARRPNVCLRIRSTPWRS